MNFNPSSGIKTFQSLVTANSPVLLVGTAIVGIVATGVLAAKGGYKARGMVDAEESKRRIQNEPALTQIDKAKLTWLCYAVPAVTGASTIASVVGVHTIHTKRHAALAGVLAVTTTKLDDYKEEAEKLLGVKKSQEVTNAIAQKNVDRGGFENSEVIITGYGNELCKDSWSGQWFTGSLNKIDSAVLAVNKKLQEEGTVTLNEFYDELGLPPNDMGQEFGWNGITLEVRTGKAEISADGRPAIVMSFHQNPEENLGLKKR